MATVKQPVIITGVKIPFWDLVSLMVNLALAAIPAAIILAFVFSALLPFLGGLLGKH